MKSCVWSIVLCLFPGFLWPQNQTDSAATLIFTGDLSFAHAFEHTVQVRRLNVFSRGKEIGAYDLMMVNLENAVTRSVDSVDKEFVFKMKPEYLSLLYNAGISIVNCANNHAADFGSEGILETIQNLDSAKICHVGIGRNLAEARRPVIRTFNGVKIGFLGYGGSENYIASRTKPGTTSRNESLILSDIKKLKPLVDVVIVTLHWGEELETAPNENQIALAHCLVDGGAGLIIGHHPHVLQGIERYHGKIIAYSLGNFIFGGNAGCANSETAVLKVRLGKRSLEVQAIPVRVRDWKPQPADSAASQRIMLQLEERSNIFQETISFKNMRSTS